MKTILILAANPKDTSRLRLDEEVREIENGLKRSQRREEYILKSLFATRLSDIRRAILDYKPFIVHFCGHGEGEAGIVFEDTDGNTKLVDSKALSGFFELFKDRIECVLLNACYSEYQAKAISQHIKFVIGMNKSIGDKVAIEFATAFYDGIGAGESIEFSYKLGCNAIQMVGSLEYSTPVLVNSDKGDSFIRISEFKANKKESLKYYLYVSDAKIDMLYNQVDSEFYLENGNQKNEKRFVSNKYYKLNKIVDHLHEKDLIGAMTDEKPYIQANLKMKFGSYGRRSHDDLSSIAFWAYNDQDFILVLAGSRYHILGHKKGGFAHSHSLTDEMTRWFIANYETKEPDKAGKDDLADMLTDYDVANGAFLAAGGMRGIVNNYEFIAKVLHRSDWKGGFRGSNIQKIVLATPLYVAHY